MEALNPDTLDRDVARTRDWLESIAQRLGRDTGAGFCALRAVLHMLRDHLPIATGAALGARLPLMIRGIYYEGWRPHATKPQVRQVEEFLGLLERELRSHAERKLDPQQALDAVLEQITAHLEPRERDEFISALPPGLRLLLRETRAPGARRMRIDERQAT